MPARKYWLKDTPGATLPLNAEPNTTSSSTGRIRVKNAASRSRVNVSSSIRTRRRPIARTPGVACHEPSRVSGAATAHASPTIAQVGLLEGRPGDGEPGHLAVETAGELGDRAGRLGRRRAARRAVGLGPRDRGELLLAAAQRGGRRDVEEAAVATSPRPAGPAARPRRGSGSSSRIVVPSAARSSTRRQKVRRAAGSKPVVGSSRKSSSGRPRMPRATSSRRRWPPESSRERWSALPVRPTVSMTSSGSRGDG